MGFVVLSPSTFDLASCPLFQPTLQYREWKGSAVLEGYLLHQHFLKLWNDNIFILFLYMNVRASWSCIIMRQGRWRQMRSMALFTISAREPWGSICNSLSKCSRIGPSTEEPSLRPVSVDKDNPLSFESAVHSSVPAEMCWEARKYLGWNPMTTGSGRLVWRARVSGWPP